MFPMIQRYAGLVFRFLDRISSTSGRVVLSEPVSYAQCTDPWSTPMSILIVDDEEEIRRLLTLFLEYRGYHAVSVTNGAEALTLLRHSAPLPELILCDWLMPVMDGAAFRQAQQQHPQLAAIPVVVLSGAADLFADAPTFRPDAYLSKPFDFAQLLTVVEQFCTGCLPPQRS